MHVLRVLHAQLAVQGVSIGVFERDQCEMRLALRLERLRCTQGADHARGFVGVLAAADEYRRTRPGVVDPLNPATLA